MPSAVKQIELQDQCKTVHKLLTPPCCRYSAEHLSLNDSESGSVGAELCHQGHIGTEVTRHLGRNTS